MTKYTLDVFEHRDGQEHLRAQRVRDFPDAQAALAWANDFYGGLAKDVPLSRFVLYDGDGDRERDRSRLRVVHERRGPKK